MSKKCKYALKALVKLAAYYQQGFLTTGAIAAEESIPRKFLEQILLELKQAKLVNSRQGVGGGYYLLKSPEDISLADIYRIFDGPIALTPCVSLNFYEPCDDCVNEGICYLRKQLLEVRDETRKSMMKATLQSFLDDRKSIARSEKKKKA